MEIERLHKMLTDAGIEHEWIDHSPDHEYVEYVEWQMSGEWKKYVALQIVVYKSDGELLVRAVEGFGTIGYGLFGEEGDSIEIMGLLTPEEEEFDSVMGCLTAEEVFRRIVEAVGDGRR